MPKQEAHYIPCPLHWPLLSRDYEKLHPCRSFDPPAVASPIDLLDNQQSPVLWGSLRTRTCELAKCTDGAENTAEPQGLRRKAETSPPSDTSHGLILTTGFVTLAPTEHLNQIPGLSHSWQV